MKKKKLLMKVLPKGRVDIDVMQFHTQFSMFLDILELKAKIKLFFFVINLFDNMV